MADKIRFILSTKVGKEGIHKGKSEIIAKLYLTRTIRVQVKTGVYILPKNFADSETGILVPKLGKLNMAERKDAFDAKQALDAQVLRLSTIIDALEEADKEISRDSFLSTKDLLDKYEIDTLEISGDAIKECRQKEIESTVVVEQKKSETFLETIEAFLKSKDATENYRKHFMVTVRSMLRYELFCQLTNGDRKNFSWDIQTTTREDIEDFSLYLKQEDKLFEQYPSIFAIILEKTSKTGDSKYKMHTIEGRGSNTIVKLQKHIKQFYKWCIETGRCNNQPFVGITIGSEHYGTPYYINIEERNQIADFDLSDSPALEVQRDVFIFQCLVGCRVGDLIKFTPANITNDILEYVPSKTKDDGIPVKPRVPLNERAKKLVEKYKGMDPQGRLFPFISNQKYNDAIKKIFTRVGITRIVQVRNAKTDEIELRPINEVAASHMARRVFIGAAYKKVKDPNLVGKMSGHVEGSKAFARYRDIDDDDLRSVIDMID